MTIFAGIITDPGSYVVWLIAGLLAGLLASQVLEAPSYGMLGDVFLGTIGGLVAGLLFGLFWNGDFAFWVSIPVAFVGGWLFIGGARCIGAIRSA
jgi:uncharacterized membrane protein YeaQ/YmgE (transglycosylase-associated protein family)